METDSTYYTDLITRYLSGEASVEEINRLDAWLKSDPAHEQQFLESHKVWLELEALRIRDTVDVDREWDKLNSRLFAINEAQKEGRIIELRAHKTWSGMNTRFLLRIAAAFVILIVSSFAAYLFLSKPDTKTILAVNAAIDQVLPDGSAVSLNKGALIQYPERFSGSRRNVSLTGEACFNVSHDKSKPFVIYSGSVRVKVLGTSFCVNTSNSRGNMEVILTTGTVLIYYVDNPGEQVILAPGEKAEISRDQQEITKVINDDPNYMAWKTHILAFNNEPLPIVVETLNKVYRCNIRITDQAVYNYHLTASFSNQSLESVLHVITATLHVKAVQSGRFTDLTANPGI